MSLARLVVAGVRLEGRTISEVARDYGVSRQWVHTLLRRYDEHGQAGLEPRSRRPRGNARATPPELEERIVELRKELTDQGLDAGAHTIAWHLQRDELKAPAPSTIWRILVRRGFITPQPQKRPKSSYTRFAADQPNERWQADTTHWQLADDNAEILNIIDDHSRLAIASIARTVFKADDVVTAFWHAIERHGPPATVLTDNGAIFTGAPRGGKVAFERQMDLLGIRLVHSRAYHPQTCGKVERFHQTLKRWLTAHDPATTIDDLQHQLDTFTELYNTRRPHRALQRQTPTQAWHARPRDAPTSPSGRPHHRIRRDTVDRAGVITLRHNSRLHHIGIGKRLTGTRVIALITDLEVRIIRADTGDLLRQLTLDPTRDYQPRGVKPGPPKNTPT